MLLFRHCRVLVRVLCFFVTLETTWNVRMVFDKFCVDDFSD